MNGNRMTRTVVLLSMLLFTAATTRADAQPSNRIFRPDSTLAASLERAFSNHPELAAAERNMQAAGLMEQQAGSWKDPKLQVSLANAPTNSFALDQEPMTGIWVMLSQAVPLTGKLGTEREIARANMRSAQQKQRLKQQMIGERAAHAWYNWAWLRMAVATVDTTVNLLDDLLEISQARYETGAGMQQDLLRLQTEIIRLKERRFDLEQNALKAGRAFTASLGRDPADLPEPPEGIELEFPPLDREALRAALKQHSPALALVIADQQRATSEARLQQQKVFPDLTLAAGYGMRQDAPGGASRPDFLTLSAGISLPLFDGRSQSVRAQAAEMRAQRSAADVRGRELELLERLESLIDEDARHGQQRNLYTGGIVPLAEATLKSSLGAYSAGKIDVESVLKAETTLLDARLMAHKHLAERASVRVSLASLLGEFTSGNESHTMNRAMGVER